MADTPLILDQSGKAFDKQGVKITMPFVVTISGTFIVEAHSREQAALAIQRATSFSAGIAPYMLGVEMSANNAPPELLAQLASKPK